MGISRFFGCVFVALVMPATAQERLSNQELGLFLNQPPVAQDDRVEMLSHQIMVIDVLANDTDDAERPLKIIKAKAMYGEVTIRTEGGLRYTPAADFVGEDAIQYSIYDGVGRLPGDEMITRQVDYQLQLRFDEIGVAVATAYQPELKKLAVLMRLAPEKILHIVGHSSGEGGHAFAQKMSERRAKTVASMMRRVHGIDPARIEILAMGDKQPLSRSKSRAAEALNRRVELSFSAELSPSLGTAQAQVTVWVNSLEPRLEPMIEVEQKPGFTPRWYVWFNQGYVAGDGSRSKFINTLAAEGLTAQVSQYDDDRSAYQLGLGYQWREHWSVEAGWADLGDVTTEFSSDLLVSEVADFINGVASVHPKSPQGVSLSGRYLYPLGSGLHLGGSLGMWRWASEYSLAADSESVSNSESGLDPFFGLAAEYRINRYFAARLQWQQFYFDDEAARLVSLGLIYRQ